jgi:protease-4
MSFLKNIISSALGLLVGVFWLLFLGLVIGFSVGRNNKTQVEKNSFLKLELNSAIKDYAPLEIDALAQLFGFPPKNVGLNEILAAIGSAKYDDRIQGISIEGLGPNAGISQLSAIRNAIVEFKKSGKPVFAYSDSFSQKQYYVSSVADSVFVSPVGQVEVKGLSSELLFFKDFQDKYGVKMEVIRHGKYKSAVEPFIANKMSESNRIQIKELLSSLWSDIVSEISLSRGISVTEINTVADGLLGRTANMSLHNSLIDGVVYKDEYKKKIESILGVDNYKTTSLMNYIMSENNFDFEEGNEDSKIAVIYAQGEIIYGEGNEDKIGQRMMVKAIERAIRNKEVKALVLRINSPGGSALASDLIWRALEVAKNKKPLVVSMGDYAASGGYYIACNADKIYAESTTITGSIGVFGMLPNASVLASRLGVYSERVSTNNSPSYSPFMKLDPEFYQVTKEGVDMVYKTFVSRVAEGRGVSYESINALAQGRVWSGRQALKNGLIDAVGSLEDAIDAAAEMAELNRYEIENYPNYEKDIRDSFRGMSFLKIEENLIQEWFGNRNYILFKQLNSLKNKEGIQMRMPYVLDIN